MLLEASGLTVELPAGWNGQLISRSRHLPTLQAASFPLDPDDEELCPRSRAMMTAGDCFLALVEYLPGSGIRPGQAPFHEPGLRLPLEPGAFSPEVAGRAVMERMFTQAGRPFALHVVIAGSRLDRRRRLPVLDRVLRSLRIEER